MLLNNMRIPALFQKGFTAVELLVVVAIIGILSTIMTLSFSNFRNNQALQNTANTVMSVIEEARTKTLSGDGNTYYSVRFESGKAVLFTGGTYNANASTNKYFSYETPVTLGTLSLNGSATAVTFDRLTGKTSQYGTIQLTRSATSSVTITVTANGTISRN